MPETKTKTTKETDCTNCSRNIQEINSIFESIKDDMPKNRHYIFRDYKREERNICIECFIKVIIMFQKY